MDPDPFFFQCGSRSKLNLFYLGEGWLWWDMGENMLGPRKGSKCGFYSGSSRHQNYDFWWGVRVFEKWDMKREFVSSFFILTI